jgi:hypothetical protein
MTDSVKLSALRLIRPIRESVVGVPDSGPVRPIDEDSMPLNLHSIVPGPRLGTVLLDDNGSLPRATVDGGEDDATVAASGWIRASLGLPAAITEVHPKSKGVPDGEPIPVLVMTEPVPTGWQPSAGLGFGIVPADLAAIPEAIRSRAAELLAELRTGAAPPALRPRWARPGWWDRATGWLEGELAAIGRPLVGEPEPFYMWGISAVIRASTTNGRVFLKAVFPPFQHEPAATRLLADSFPGAIPRVLAIEPDEGWLVLEDIGDAWIDGGADEDRPMRLAAGARAIVELQRSATGLIDPMREIGCPHRPLAALPDALEAALAGEAIGFVNAAPELDRRSRAVDGTKAAVGRLLDLGFPETIIHGDFHAGNAAILAGRVVIIDWSDAAIGSPIVDLATWLLFSMDKPTERRAATDAWVQAWAGPTAPADVHDRIGDILLAGSAYQVVSYDGIVRALEPATRYTMGGGARRNFERLEMAMDGWKP